MGALQMENTHMWDNIEGNLTAHISMLQPEQYTFKLAVVKFKCLCKKYNLHL
jgi:hypothetical protein